MSAVIRCGGSRCSTTGGSPSSRRARCGSSPTGASRAACRRSRRWTRSRSRRSPAACWAPRPCPRRPRPRGRASEAAGAAAARRTTARQQPSHRLPAAPLQPLVPSPPPCLASSPAGGRCSHPPGAPRGERHRARRRHDGRPPGGAAARRAAAPALQRGSGRGRQLGRRARGELGCRRTRTRPRRFLGAPRVGEWDEWDLLATNTQGGRHMMGSLNVEARRARTRHAPDTLPRHSVDTP